MRIVAIIAGAGGLTVGSIRSVSILSPSTQSRHYQRGVVVTAEGPANLYDNINKNRSENTVSYSVHVNILQAKFQNLYWIVGGNAACTTLTHETVDGDRNIPITIDRSLKY